MIICTQIFIGNRKSADIRFSSGIIGRVIEHADWDSHWNMIFEGYIPIILIPDGKPIIYRYNRYPNTDQGFIDCAKDALRLAREWEESCQGKIQLPVLR